MQIEPTVDKQSSAIKIRDEGGTTTKQQHLDVDSALKKPFEPSFNHLIVHFEPKLQEIDEAEPTIPDVNRA